jgi:hypothetical protein
MTLSRQAVCRGTREPVCNEPSRKRGRSAASRAHTSALVDLGFPVTRGSGTQRGQEVTLRIGQLTGPYGFIIVPSVLWLASVLILSVEGCTSKSDPANSVSPTRDPDRSGISWPAAQEKWAVTDVDDQCVLVVGRGDENARVRLLRIKIDGAAALKSARAFLLELLLGRSVQVDNRDPEFQPNHADGAIQAYVYLLKGNENEVVNINIELVRKGLAELDSSEGEGKYQRQLQQALKHAKAEGCGIWK